MSAVIMLMTSMKRVLKMRMSTRRRGGEEEEEGAATWHEDEYEDGCEDEGEDELETDTELADDATADAVDPAHVTDDLEADQSDSVADLSDSVADLLLGSFSFEWEDFILLSNPVRLCWIKLLQCVAQHCDEPRSLLAKLYK
eukprot:gene14689-14845_t